MVPLLSSNIAHAIDLQEEDEEQQQQQKEQAEGGAGGGAGAIMGRGSSRPIGWNQGLYSLLVCIRDGTIHPMPQFLPHKTTGKAAGIYNVCMPWNHQPKAQCHKIMLYPNH